jgi:hypothetical protein
MIAIAKPSVVGSTNSSTKAEADWRDHFADMLPAICRHASICFRGLRAEARAEAIQEVAAQAFVAYARLVQLGKEDVAYAAPLAKFAVHRVRSGRTVGGRLNVDDVTSKWCRTRRNIHVESLHEHDGRDGWREIVVEDRRNGPAEVVATRIDFAAWLRSLTRRDRRMAEMLAAGEETTTVAHSLRVSPGRVSQLRHKLHEAWRRFEGENGTAPLPNPACV